MHMKKNIINILLLLLLPLSAMADDISFTASAPSSVVEGNQFRLVFTVNTDNGKNLRVAPMDGFRVLAGPSTSSSRSYQMINGKTSSMVSQKITYILMAEKEGTYTMPAATIEVKGQTYKSNEVTVKVLKAGQAGTESGSTKDQFGISADDLFVRNIVTKKKVYQQEYLVSTIKLYYTVNVSDFANANLPKYNGFWQYELEIPEDQRGSIENVNGRNYRTYLLKQTILYPQRSGTIEIEPTELEVVLRLRTNNRSNDPFADFFNSYQDVRRKIHSKGETITVLPFPAGRPATFSSLTGDFKMVANIDKTEVKANEPVTVRVTISGNGNLKMAKTPVIEFPGDFETYDPKISNNLKYTTSGVTGSRTFEFLAIPRYGGEYKIPSYSFSYFDPKAKTYKTLSTPEYVLNVEKSDQP